MSLCYDRPPAPATGFPVAGCCVHFLAMRAARHCATCETVTSCCCLDMKCRLRVGAMHNSAHMSVVGHEVQIACWCNAQFGAHVRFWTCQGSWPTTLSHGRLNRREWARTPRRPLFGNKKCAFLCHIRFHWDVPDISFRTNTCEIGHDGPEAGCCNWFPRAMGHL